MTSGSVHVVPPGTEPEFMLRFALADLPAIGPRFQERLARFGARTGPDVVGHDRETLGRWAGGRGGTWVYRGGPGRHTPPGPPEGGGQVGTPAENFPAR